MQNCQLENTRIVGIMAGVEMKVATKNATSKLGREYGYASQVSRRRTQARWAISDVVLRRHACREPSRWQRPFCPGSRLHLARVASPLTVVAWGIASQLHVSCD
jgi:hypothetical protein